MNIYSIYIIHLMWHQHNTKESRNKYSQLNFDRSAQLIQEEKESLFDKWFWDNEVSAWKKKKQTLSLTSRNTTLNTKQARNLNAKAK